MRGLPQGPSGIKRRHQIGRAQEVFKARATCNVLPRQRGLHFCFSIISIVAQRPNLGVELVLRVDSAPMLAEMHLLISQASKFTRFSDFTFSALDGSIDAFIRVGLLERRIELGEAVRLDAALLACFEFGLILFCLIDRRACLLLREQSCVQAGYRCIAENGEYVRPVTAHRELEAFDAP